MAEKFPKTVCDDEDVARIIFSPSYIYKGRVAPTAFRWEILPSGHAEDYISVLRGDTSELGNQTESFRPRTKGDTCYGYALLRVGNVRGIAFDDIDCTTDVQSFPSKTHPNHAGIVAEIGKERVTALTPVSPEMMMVQKELASLCGEIKKFK
ncbi:MAG: hypothetical protein IJP74_02295 [Prevotella sp.]|nr:hypothetical protein [Prevotella sp.]